MVTKTADVVTKNEEEARKVVFVDPEKLEDNPFQTRQHYAQKDIEELMISIEEHGLRQYPEAREKDGKIQLAYGHKRKRSFIKLKKKDRKKWGTIPVYLVEISDEDMFYFAFEENMRRSDITPLETARGIENFLTVFPDKKEEEIAKKLNMTQGNVSNMRRVLRLPREILDKVDEGKINFTMARELLILKDIKDIGKYQGRYDSGSGNYPMIEKTDVFLMLEAVRGISGNSIHGCSATVDGLKKSIYYVAHSHLKALEKGTFYCGSDREPLLDTVKAGCAKCPSRITVFETKSQRKHYCHNFKCWDKNQKKHKDAAAKQAREKMTQDVLTKISEAETARQESGNISQEISVIEEKDVDELNEEEMAMLNEVLDSGNGSLPKRKPGHDLCQECLNALGCEGRGVRLEDNTGEGVLVCDDRVTKENFAQVTKNATMEIPDQFKELLETAAGTRAQILDLEELRVGSEWSNQLKAGHLLLNDLNRMDDPEECTQRCTAGFHYAFDSRNAERGTSMVCTNPRCVSKKKAAFTRAKNAKGQAKKRAEETAIKEAVDLTTILDRPRLKLMVTMLVLKCEQHHHQGEHAFSLAEWWAQKAGIETGHIGYWERGKYINQVMDAVDKMTDEEIAKALVESMLKSLTYIGLVEDYKIQTTEILNWMGVTPKVEDLKKKEKKEVKK